MTGARMLKSLYEYSNNIQIALFDILGSMMNLIDHNIKSNKLQSTFMHLKHQEKDKNKI